VILLALLYLPVNGAAALIIGPIQSYSLSRLDRESHPHGITILNTGFQIAGCVGASLFTGIYAGISSSRITAGIPFADAAANGFLVAGLLAAIFALAGFFLALRLWKFKAAVSAHDQESSALRQIMKSDPYTLSPSDRIIDALRMFVEKHISGAPVVDESGKIVAIVSDGDIMRHLATHPSAFKNAWSFAVESLNDDFDGALAGLMERPIAGIGTHHIITIDANAGLGTACQVLVDHHLRKAPVVDEGRLVGIINLSNISRYSIGKYLETADARM
jgi:DHA2 family lincomycin resistance protein-like MFS transporter